MTIISKMKKNNPSPKILFRTSGGMAKGKELGFGHIFRSANLASFFKNSNMAFLIEDFGQAKKTLESKKFKNISILTKNISLDDDIKKTKSFIQNHDIEILIIDKYKTKPRFVKELKKYVKVVVISDLTNIDYDSDLLFNGFIGFKNKIIKNRFGTKCFLGPNYQILNKIFSNKSKFKKKYDLLSTFGGFDEKHISDKLIQALSNYTHDMNVKIIQGSFLGNKKIQKSILNKHISLKIIKISKNIQKDFLQSKFVICSGGITTYELAAKKIPFAIICQNKHQLITAKEWEKLGIAVNLGIVNKQSQNDILKLLINIKEKNIHLKKLSKNIVDGLGGSRVYNEIINNCYKH
jgi:spore coat polysaccharide biosynthesis predicted glycosyltransferase SpsG